MPYRLATPQQSYFSVSYFPNAVKHFYAFGKILFVFSAKSAIVSVIQNAPVAQLDRVSASEAEGRGFESRRAHQFKKNPRKRIFLLGRRGAEKNTRRGFGERKRTTPSCGPVRDEERSDEQSRRAHQFKKNPRKRIFLLGRIDFQFYFRLFSIALIAAGNCPNAVISASACVPQYSCSP